MYADCDYTFGFLPLNAFATNDSTNNTKKTKNRICAIPDAAPATNEMTKSTINTKNRIFAIPVAAPAIPVNPNSAAIIAIIKNVIAQPNIMFSSIILRFRK